MGDVPLMQHFDRALREAYERAEVKISAIAEKQEAALDHHQQLHAVEHQMQERVSAANQQRYEEAIQALQSFREEVDKALSGLVTRTMFDAHVSLYSERHHEIREMARGQMDRVRDDVGRDMEREREARVLADSRINDSVANNATGIAEIKSMQKAWAAAAAALATLISLIIGGLGIVIGGG